MDSDSGGGIFCHGGVISTLPYPLSLVGENFFASWAAFGATALLAVALTSGPLFYVYYWPSQVRFYNQ
jgi:hypothetical protein